MHIRPKPPNFAPPPPRPFATPQTGLYAKKFEKLHLKQTPGPLALITELVGRIYRYITLDDPFKWQTHMHAEHMSHGSLAGNVTEYAIKKIIQLLKHTESPPTDLLHGLNYAHKVLRGKLSASDIKRDIQNLKVGESLAIPSNSKKHAMMLYITCTSDTEEGKKFTVEQHNQGEGIGNFHYNKVDANGKQQFQTVLEITDVRDEHLSSTHAPFIDKLLQNRTRGTTVNFYENILPLLHGKLAPPSSDQRLWSHGQLGGSCSAAATLSLIRSRLDKPAYKAFRDLGRFEMLLKSFSEIKSGWGNTSTQKAVTLEVVKQLERSLHKRTIAIPHELHKMKQQLEKTAKATHIKEPPLRSLADNINHSFNILKRGHFTQETIQASAQYLIRTLDSSKTPVLSRAETKKLVKTINHLVNYCKDRPLTKDQIYAMTVLSTAILNFTVLFQSENHLDKETLSKINKFCSTMHMRYNGLSLGSFYKNGEIDRYVSHYQKLYFSNNKTIPTGLEQLRTKMEA